MTSRMEEFRQFVNKYPKIRDDVVSGKKTWQNIYEDWVILGENNSIWDKYKESKKETIDLLSSENLRNIMNYVKKINPDSISKTLNKQDLTINMSFNNDEEENDSFYSLKEDENNFYEDEEEDYEEEESDLFINSFEKDDGNDLEFIPEQNQVVNEPEYKETYIQQQYNLFH